MKPLYLKIEAFGPFKDTEIVDFTKFSNDELFLISGPTGSGKTTIFDAMCYALFNEMTGDYRKDSSVRSQYADKDKLCKVTFEFENNGVKYKIERSPKQKAIGRGGKEVEKAPTAFLYNESNQIADKVNEVTKEVVRILGYDAKQFRKIVVLPQGKFIDILNAKPEEREQMLSTILQTTKYEEITNKIKEKANELYLSIKDVDSKIQGIFESVNVKSFEELSDISNKTNTEFVEVKTKKDEIDTEVSNIKNSIIKGETQEKIKKDYQLLLKQYEELKQDESVYKKLAEKVKILDSISPVEKVEYQLNTETKNLALMNKEFGDCFAILSKEREISEELSKKMVEIEAIKSDIILKQAKLLEIAKLEGEYKAYQDSLKRTNEIAIRLVEIDNGITQGNLGLNKVQVKQVELQQQIQEINNKLKIINEAKVEIELIKNKLSALKQYNTDKQKKVLINKELEDVNKLILNKSIDIDNDKKKYNKLQELHSIYQASILAEKLEPMKPCPVCGSCNHPIIAHSSDVISIDMINNLNEVILEKNKEKAKLDERIYQLNKELASINLSLREDIDENVDYEVKAINLNNIIAEEDTTAKSLTITNDYLKMITEQITNSKEQLAAYDSEKRALLEEKKLVEDKIKKCSGYLGTDIDIEKNTIDRMIKVNQKKVNDYENEKASNKEKLELYNSKYTSLKQKIKEKEVLKTSLETVFESKLIEGNITFDEYSNYKNELSKLEQYRTTVNKYYNSIIAKESECKSLKMQIDSYKEINIEALRYLLKEKEIIQTGVVANYEKLLASKKKLQDALNNIINYKKAINDDANQYHLYEKLAEITSGNRTGLKKISLQRYVLCLILDDILLTANDYLQRFSDGRYSFVRAEGHAISQKGLEMNVLDNNTDDVRSVSTLSGGESFIASLAFALGMSEEIGSRHGGISIDALFIDEGFGALDEKMLNLALNALADIKQSGKMIGIISHVEELKNIIGNKIIVEKTNDGSHISTILE